jgi:hypothetical protein
MIDINHFGQVVTVEHNTWEQFGGLYTTYIFNFLLIKPNSMHKYSQPNFESAIIIFTGYLALTIIATPPPLEFLLAQ